MTQIDFYILNDSSQADRFGLACRIVEKAWAQGHRVYCHAENFEQAQHLDRLLWTYRESSFLPHGLVQEAKAKLNPILIGHSNECANEHDVLVNVANDTPAFFSRFTRLAECVDNNPDTKVAGRKRFRFYREHGYPLNTHEIRL